MINCHCVQPLKMVYGMPVLLIAKLIPKSGDPITIEKKQISKFHKALASIMHSITENVFVKFIGLFECRADPKNYYLSLIVVRSFPGHDSKETIKSFLGYLDNTKMVDMNIGRTTYSVRLTSRIRLWNEATKLHDDFNFADLETKVHNHTILFSTNHLYKVYDQSFQILSPLLYCRQIQLNDSEFVEEDEQLTTFLTPKNITLMYYIRVSPSEVRVCADHYMGTSHHNAGNNVRHSVISMYTRVLFLFICGIFHVC